MISTHAPAGGATSSHEVLSCRRIKFLLTPLREGRQFMQHRRNEIREISTHAPAGGATRSAAKGHERGICISTHAPAGGATRVHRPECQAHPISTHAPAGGATGFARRTSRWRPDFYSRPCGRGDHFTKCQARSRWNFYSRPCGRGDAGRWTGSRWTVRFLLTPLREGRR